jgi:hypothetical protein
MQQPQHNPSAPSSASPKERMYRFTGFTRLQQNSGLFPIRLAESTYTNSRGKRVFVRLLDSAEPDSPLVQHLADMLGRSPTANEVAHPEMFLGQRALLQVGLRFGQSVILSIRPP